MVQIRDIQPTLRLVTQPPKWHWIRHAQHPAQTAAPQPSGPLVQHQPRALKPQAQPSGAHSVDDCADVEHATEQRSKVDAIDDGGREVGAVGLDELLNGGGEVGVGDYGALEWGGGGGEGCVEVAPDAGEMGMGGGGRG